MAQITAPIILDSTAQDMAESLRALAGRKPNTWEGIRAIINSGRGAAALPVGTQIEDAWGGYAALWDVVHHDSSGSMYLNWHFALPNELQYDAPEAIYCADANGLAAGTYYITIGANYGAGWVAGKHIQFTLTRAMEEGDQLFIDCGASYGNDPTDGRTWSVYHAGNTTVLETGVTSDGTDGTELGTVGTNGTHAPDGLLNAISHTIYGSGRWSESAYRQYLNSAGAAGLWWTPKNIWDRPPAQHDAVPGFLTGCSEEFLAILRPVSVVTALNSVSGYTETSETTLDRIFLPSMQEYYITPEFAGIEGEDWRYYQELAGETGLTEKFVYGQKYPILKKYNLTRQTSAAARTALRSMSVGSSAGTLCIRSDGELRFDNSTLLFRACPACKIMKTTD